MKKPRCNEEQIAFALKWAELGTKVEELSRQMGVSQAMLFSQEAIVGGLGCSELRRLRQPEEKNRKLRTLVADLSLDKSMLRDVLTKKSSAWSAARASSVYSARVRRQRAQRLRGIAV